MDKEKKTIQTVTGIDENGNLKTVDANKKNQNEFMQVDGIYFPISSPTFGGSLKPPPALHSSKFRQRMPLKQPKKCSFSITEEFGGTYESGKSDFTRKEFKHLISKVESSRKKPYAILVYKMSRFSRSGGSAIGLVNRLVDELGVHLIEVTTGLSTTTERGKAAIYESLFHAYKENLERKEIIIPSMKAYLEKGNRLGTCPQGYDHYGPRVKRKNSYANIKR
ncbi:MAG: recombinase family protein [Niabella sp.]